MAFNNFPYLDLSNLNIDWILQTVRTALLNSTTALEAAENLKDFVENYFSDLDVQEQINAEIDSMVDDGTFQLLVDVAAGTIAPTIITEWLEANITPTTPAIDKTLSVSDAAADALVTGTAIKRLDAGLSFYEIPWTSYSPTWTQGAINSNTGANTTSTTRARTAYSGAGTVDKLLKVKIEAGYKLAVFVYSNANNASYLGVYDGREYSGNTVVWFTDYVYFADNMKGIRYRFVLAKTDDSEITVADATGKVTGFYGTDSTLSEQYKAADAKAVGDRFVGNATRLAYDSTDVASTTANGVTYEISDGVASFSGTSNARVLLNRIGGVGTIPDFLEENTNYFVDINESGSGNVKISITRYDNDGTAISPNLFSSNSSGYFNTGSFADVAGIIIRYNIPANSDVDDTTVEFSIYDYPPNSAININGNGGRTKLRIMQNNIGDFAWGFNSGIDASVARGNLPDTDQYYNPYYKNVVESYASRTEFYADRLAKYKEFFGKYQPDILCLQEYAINFNWSDVPAETAINASEALFEPVFMDKSAAKDAKGYYLRVFSNAGLAAGSYVSIGQITAVHWYVSSTTINGKPWAICTGYFVTSDYGGQPARESELMDLLEYLDANGYENAIICGDFNASAVAYTGPHAEVVNLNLYPDYASTVAGASTNNEALALIAESYGYTVLNSGEYWGWKNTYVDHKQTQPNYIRPLDQILVRGDFKAVNFEVLEDEYDNLTSDHIPIIADIIFN